jgi:hypothetical protein
MSDLTRGAPDAIRSRIGEARMRAAERAAAAGTPPTSSADAHKVAAPAPPARYIPEPPRPSLSAETVEQLAALGAHLGEQGAARATMPTGSGLSAQQQQQQGPQGPQPSAATEHAVDAVADQITTAAEAAMDAARAASAARCRSKIDLGALILNGKATQTVEVIPGTMVVVFATTRESVAAYASDRVAETIRRFETSVLREQTERLRAHIEMAASIESIEVYQDGQVVSRDVYPALYDPVTRELIPDRMQDRLARVRALVPAVAAVISREAMYFNGRIRDLVEAPGALKNG